MLGLRKWLTKMSQRFAPVGKNTSRKEHAQIGVLHQHLMTRIKAGKRR
jgi:hypothetical protein